MSQNQPENGESSRGETKPDLPKFKFDLPQDLSNLRPGDSCPRCSDGRLDFDGTLNLACPDCGFVLAGCFT